jgi:L,D-transpeptidase catalytic domain
MAPRHTFGSHPPRDVVPNRRREQPATPDVPPPARRSSGPGPSGPTPLVGALVGVLLGAGALGALTWSSGCASDEEPKPSASDAPSSGSDAFDGVPSAPVPEETDAPVVEEPTPKAEVEPEPDKPWEGPWLGALARSTPIYPTARFSKNRMGYIRKGGKAPVVDKPVKTKSCKQGFYPLVDGGFVCGKYATTNLDDPRFKMGIRQPDVEALLPYKYAYNKAHGTPLYISVPSKEEMLAYEPYLKPKPKKKKKPSPEDKKAADVDAEKSAEKADQPRSDKLPAAKKPVEPPTKTAEAGDDGETTTKSAKVAKTDVSKGDGGGLQFLSDDGPLGAGGGAAEPEKPWWENDSVDVKLSDLDEKDGTLSKRMVKGFFIAVDRTFGWNDRLWYKTTDGLIAPTDRMIIPKTPDLEGIEISGDTKGVAFVLWRKAHKYDWPKDADAPKRKAKLARFTAVGLTGETRVYDKKRFRQTVDGWWFKDAQGTWTEPGARPEEVGEDEKWVDVNLSRKTLMAFVGDQPVYAALTSPGKRSKVRSKDHRTKIGKWRIREKHITTTMDGDGPAGDLPYSIQDVPYVQYYDGSYALHGAFWHHNFGREQSHGCVNLSPRDAKHMFMWTEPQLPRGWHGVWSSDKRKGTLVVVHN